MTADDMNTSGSDTTQSGRSGKKPLIRPMTVLPVILACIFALSIFAMFATMPKSRMQPPEQKQPVVEAMQIDVSDEPVTTTAQGVVAPANGSVELRAQVGGDVMAVHENFTPGGVIPAGEPVLRIDPTDYRLALADAQAALDQARAAVDIETGQQRVAEAEFQLLEEDIEFDEASRALALRKPQLRRVQAELETAKAAVDRARINLNRTELTLPYDAIVLDVNAIVGEYLGAREIAGTFARADEFWVELRVRHDVLGRLNTRARNGEGSSVAVSINETTYPGEVIRLRADVSEETRLGGAFVAIADPLSMEPQNRGRPPLLIGSYVEAELDAGTVEDIIAMPRRALRDNNEVYVADAEDELATRSVRIAWELEDTVLVRPTFEPGDRIITSRVSGVAPGTRLRVRTGGDSDADTPGDAGEAAAIDAPTAGTGVGGGPVGGSGR